MKLQDLHEGKYDQVIKLVQKELWPIAKRLEVRGKNGAVKTMRDVDGSVLRDSQEKAREIIAQYKGSNAEQHLRAINNARSYEEVMHTLTNVLLKTSGQGVIRPGDM